MRVLIGCESSGIIRDAFRKLGHDAYSCDLLPCEGDPTFHFQCDVRTLLKPGMWDLFICHPDCTYLTNSAAWAFGDGPYHQKVKPGTLVGADRRAAREEALAFVREMMDAPVPHIAIENPVGVISTQIKPASQYIQPHEYGDDASKKTGLWLKNLPLLRPTRSCPPRIVEWPKGSGKMVQRWSNQTDSGQNRLSPGADRWIERSRTYQGWAEAMASQWGEYVQQAVEGREAA
ncbi:DNA cytosine methyltransferase [Marinobacter sp.]|uniref:DNA cytosine methyltransferase n=1 Tax=Marinobacter sp. TaxID=50741 RepID=UPI0035665725